VEEKPKAGDLLKGRDLPLVSVEADEPVLLAIDRMRKHNIDQLPVFENGKPVGTVTDSRLFAAILEDAEVRTQKSRMVMGPALPVIGLDTTLEEIAKKLGNGSPAVLVEQPNGYGIITKQDIIGKLK
jgi:cystathionine beta-synthase